jgi:hypothetical protein
MLGLNSRALTIRAPSDSLHLGMMAKKAASEVDGELALKWMIHHALAVGTTANQPGATNRRVREDSHGSSGIACALKGVWHSSGFGTDITPTY